MDVSATSPDRRKCLAKASEFCALLCPFCAQEFLKRVRSNRQMNCNCLFSLGFVWDGSESTPRQVPCFAGKVLIGLLGSGRISGVRVKRVAVFGRPGNDLLSQVLRHSTIGA